jgi:hypothetical protein
LRAEAYVTIRKFHANAPGQGDPAPSWNSVHDGHTDCTNVGRARSECQSSATARAGCASLPRDVRSPALISEQRHLVTRAGGSIMTGQTRMASFVGLHLEHCSNADVIKVVGDWLEPLGFAEAEPFQSVPAPLEQTRLRSTDAVGCERLNDSWHLVLFNSHLLGGALIDEVAVRPVSERTPGRIVLVQAQTTSDVCQLVILDRGELVRLLAHADGQMLQDSGPPLPGEPSRSNVVETSRDSDDPPSPLRVAHSICAALGFDLWRSPPLQGPGHVWKRRSLWARLLRL